MEKLPHEIKNILVTGGSGFIGGELIINLLQNTNANIFNLDKLSNYSNNLRIENFLQKNKKKINSRYTFLKGDLLNNSFLDRSIKFSKPDLVFHLAAESHVDRSITNPKNFLESNIVGTFNLLNSSLLYWEELKNTKKLNFRFIHISTDEVFGSLGKVGKFNEKSSYNPSSPYSASKASSDHLVNSWHHTYGLPTMITYCTNNYGPWQYPEKLIPKIILSALSLKKIPIYGDGLNTRDWIFVKDHINCLISLASRGEIGERYCIGSNTEKTNLEIAKIICNYLDNKEPSKISYSDLIYFVNDRPGHDLRYAINPAKINNKLKWFPKYNFQESLEETINWYINNVSIFK